VTTVLTSEGKGASMLSEDQVDRLVSAFERQTDVVSRSRRPCSRRSACARHAHGPQAGSQRGDPRRHRGGRQGARAGRFRARVTPACGGCSPREGSRRAEKVVNESDAKFTLSYSPCNRSAKTSGIYPPPYAGSVKKRTTNSATASRRLERRHHRSTAGVQTPSWRRRRLTCRPISCSCSRPTSGSAA